MVVERKQKIKRMLEKKKYLVEEMLNISHLQKKWIEEENYKRLLNAINTKQDKIEKINRINQSFEWIPDGDIEFKLIIEEIRSIMLEIKKLDDYNAANINKMMQVAKEQMKDVNVKKTVQTAYSQAKKIQKDGCFIDKFK